MSKSSTVAYDVTGVSVWTDREEDDGPPEPLPSDAEVRRRTEDLCRRGLAWIADRYGLTEATVRDYELGLEWRGRRGAEPWLSIPIRDADGALVNVRRRYAGKRPELHATGEKYRNLKGRGEVRGYPAHRLPPEGARLLVCCGEADALVFRQATGLAAVTSTGGASNWPESGWDDLAARFDVTVIYDRGEEEFARRIADRLGARFRALPQDLPVGTDLADLYRECGSDALRALLPTRPRRVVRRRKAAA